MKYLKSFRGFSSFFSHCIGKIDHLVKKQIIDFKYAQFSFTEGIFNAKDIQYDTIRFWPWMRIFLLEISVKRKTKIYERNRKWEVIG